MGNSLLLHFTEEDQNTVITIDDTDSTPREEVPKKRSEDEELEVYGIGTITSVQLRKFIFEVCDSIFNVGPINFMCVGERIEIEEGVSHFRHAENIADIKLEIVTASGYGKNGAICVLLNSICPQIITSFELSGKF